MTLFPRVNPRVNGLLFLLLTTTLPVQSAARLDYSAASTAASSRKVLEIQDGHVRLLNAMNHPKIDLYFDGPRHEWTIVDHDRRRVMPLNEASLRGLSARIGLFAPLLGGLGDQLHHLNPGQRQKWASLLDRLPMDWLKAPGRAAKGSERRDQKHTETLLGIPCSEESLEVGQQTVRLCLARSDTLPMGKEDVETLAAMEKSAHTLIQLGRQMALKLGLSLPGEDALHEPGIPLRVRTDAPNGHMDMRLSAIRSVGRQPHFVSVPSHYHREPLTLW